MRTFSLAHIGGEADEFSARRPARRRLVKLKSFLELHQFPDSPALLIHIEVLDPVLSKQLRSRANSRPKFERKLSTLNVAATSRHHCGTKSPRQDSNSSTAVVAA